MVQGNTKGLQSKASTGRKAQRIAANTKKGQRTVAPKKPILIKQAALRKDLTAKIKLAIERQMVSAASSGKLTIMKNTMPEGSSSSSSLNRIKPGKRVLK